MEIYNVLRAKLKLMLIGLGFCAPVALLEFYVSGEIDIGLVILSVLSVIGIVYFKIRLFFHVKSNELLNG